MALALSQPNVGGGLQVFGGLVNTCTSSQSVFTLDPPALVVQDCRGVFAI